MTRTNNRELLRPAVRGFFWTAAGTGVQAVLQIVVLMVLARLLVPRDFGLVAAAHIVVSFSEIFATLGVGPALVQRAELEERHRESAHVLSLVMGFLLGGAVFALAGPIALFFQVDGLTAVVRVMAVVFPVTGLSVVSTAQLNRDLAFRRLTRIQIASFVGYAIVGIALALLGAGVWALVCAVLAEKLVATVMTLRHRRPPRHLRLQGAAIRDLLEFGGGHTALRLSNFFAVRGDYIVTGRVLGVTALGFYERAYRLMAVPVQLLGMVVDRVLFPILSRVQDDPALLAKAYLTVITLTATAILPLSAMALALSPEVIRVVLGDQWGSAVAPFQILVLGMYLRMGYRVGLVLTQARGAVYRGAWRQAVYAVLVIGGAWVGSGWGIEGVAVGVLLALLGTFLLTSYLVESITSHGWPAFALAHVPALGLAGLAGAGTWGAAELLRDAGVSPLLILLSCTGAGGLLLGAALALFPRRILGRHGLEVVRTGVSRVRANLRSRV